MSKFVSGANVCRTKTQVELASEWDELAEIRHLQLARGLDLSFDHVIVPSVLRLLANESKEKVLDIGCGTGHFSRLLSIVSTRVVGIDPSRRSIDFAKEVCVNQKNIAFIQSSLEDAGGNPEIAGASAAVAVMVLMTTPNLEVFVRTLKSVLRDDGVFVSAIPHPCFWPQYWGYADKEWFDYRREIFIEAPFRISNSASEVHTTHIHRPLNTYFSEFAKFGFFADEVEEPFPDENVAYRYPEPWRFPRFLIVRWRKYSLQNPEEKSL